MTTTTTITTQINSIDCKLPDKVIIMCKYAYYNLMTLFDEKHITISDGLRIASHIFAAIPTYDNYKYDGVCELINITVRIKGHIIINNGLPMVIWLHVYYIVRTPLININGGGIITAVYMPLDYLTYVDVRAEQCPCSSVHSPYHHQCGDCFRAQQTTVNNIHHALSDHDLASWLDNYVCGMNYNVFELHPYTFTLCDTISRRAIIRDRCECSNNTEINNVMSMFYDLNLIQTQSLPLLQQSH